MEIDVAFLIIISTEFYIMVLNNPGFNLVRRVVCPDSKKASSPAFLISLLTGLSDMQELTA